MPEPIFNTDRTDEESTDPDPHPAFEYDLTGFQRDLLIATAFVDIRPEASSGQRVKEWLETYSGRDVTHGRLYPNLDTLVDAGLIEKAPIDRRTHRYTPTDAARQYLHVRGGVYRMADKAGDA